MFTGLVEEQGKLVRVSSRGANRILEIETGLELKEGASLAVNGVCLTVISRDKGRVRVEATRETVERTTLGETYGGDRVNLESALTLERPLGGHLVQGHVDEVGKVTGVRKTEEARQIEIAFSREHDSLVVDQGSVAVDGVSLTVLKKLPGPKLVVNVISETLKRTTLGERRVGDKVNLEFDILAKYVREQVKRQ